MVSPTLELSGRLFDGAERVFNDTLDHAGFSDKQAARISVMSLDRAISDAVKHRYDLRPHFDVDGVVDEFVLMRAELINRFRNWKYGILVPRDDYAKGFIREGLSLEQEGTAIPDLAAGLEELDPSATDLRIEFNYENQAEQLPIIRLP